MHDRHIEARQLSEWSPGERAVAQLGYLLVEAGADLRSILTSVNITCSVREFLGGELLNVPQEKLHHIRGVLLHDLAHLLADRASHKIAAALDWKLVFFCLVNNRTLREGIERTHDVFKVMDGRCGWLSLAVDPLEANVRIDSLWPERDAASFAVDALTMALFIDMFSWLISQQLPVSRVAMNYPADVLARFDAGFLPKPLIMGADSSGFVFPAAYLDFPVTRTTEECEVGIEKVLSGMFDLGAENIRLRPVERTRRLMFRALRDRGEFPSLAALSDQLGCSKSQLRRWLAQDGMSYNAIKVSSRRELALDLLRRSQLSIEDISTRLGFWNANAFRKAFRQWTRLSPTEYRKGASAAH